MLIRQKQSNKELTILPKEWEEYKKRGDSEMYTIVDWGDIVQLFERKGGQIAVTHGLFDREHADRVISAKGAKFFVKEIDHANLEKAEISRSILDNPDALNQPSSEFQDSSADFTNTAETTPKKKNRKLLDKIISNSKYIIITVIAGLIIAYLVKFFGWN